MDLKARIPVLARRGYSVKKICSILGIKKTLVYSTLKYSRHYSIPYNPHHMLKRGRHRILSANDLRFIRSLLMRRHTMFLDELQLELRTQCNVSVALSTISRALRRMNITRKNISAHALERNELRHAAFMNHIADVVTDPNMLIFIDESARNRHTSQRRKGWSQAGTRCIQRQVFVRGQRYSILPILTLDGIITHDIIPGSVTAYRFLKFLRELVIPLTNPYPGPRSVIILDNCSIHHTEEVRALVEDEASCRLIFLPPYSPDLNPIEQAFSFIKVYLRRCWNDDSLSIVDHACHSIAPQHAYEFFRNSGYIA